MATSKAQTGQTAHTRKTPPRSHSDDTMDGADTACESAGAPITVNSSQTLNLTGGTGAEQPAPTMIDDMGASGDTPGSLALREVTEALLPALSDLPRTPQQARSREKRAELLKAAEALYVGRGYANTTADEIASAAGVSVGTFYNYFRNKRQILLALALERLEDIFTHLRVARMDLASGDAHDQHEALRTAVESIVVGGPRTGLRHVWQELMSVEPELIPYQQVIRRYALTRLEGQLRMARDLSKTWPDLDVEGTALAIFALLDALSARHDESLRDDRIIASVTTLIERALFPPAISTGALGLEKPEHGVGEG